MLRSLIAVCALGAATSVSAQLPVGTISASGYPGTNGGELTSCNLEFLNFHSDATVTPPKFIAVSGTITLSASEMNAGFGVKVVVNEIGKGPTGITRTPAAPFEINLASISGTSTYGTKTTQIDSTTPGGKVIAFSFFDEKIQKMMLEINETQNAIILFNRTKGGGDVRIPVDFTVADSDANGKKVRNNSAMQNYMDCQVKLLSKALARPQK